MYKETTIFLSSTSRDLHHYRDAVRESLDKMDNVKCVGMESFGARPTNPYDTCMNKLAECDLFIGITGVMYGSSPDWSEKSYTELEYDKATNEKIDKLMFVTPKDFTLEPSLIECDVKSAKQHVFRNKVKDGSTIDRATSPYQLAADVSTAVLNWLGRPKVELRVPPGTYAFVIEDSKNIHVSIKKSVFESITISPFENGQIIKKIIIANIEDGKTNTFDFTKGELPETVSHSRASSASLSCPEFPSNDIADIDEPRFIQLTDGDFGLLIERDATNNAYQSEFTDTQTVLLNKGEYTIMFCGDKSIQLNGAINANLNPGIPFTFHVTSDKHGYLQINAIGSVKHLQIEHGKKITSNIKTNGCPVTRIQDKITLIIPDGV